MRYEGVIARRSEYRDRDYHQCVFFMDDLLGKKPTGCVREGHKMKKVNYYQRARFMTYYKGIQPVSCDSTQSRVIKYGNVIPVPIDRNCSGSGSRK